MATLTKAQLIEQLAAERHNNELLRNEVASLRAERLAALTAERDTLRTEVKAEIAAFSRPAARAVYEFDPTIPGDFARASTLAKTNRGIVRRIGR